MPQTKKGYKDADPIIRLDKAVDRRVGGAVGNFAASLEKGAGDETRAPLC